VIVLQWDVGSARLRQTWSADRHTATGVTTHGVPPEEPHPYHLHAL